MQDSQSGRRAHASARVLNLVAVVDREWRGDIEDRLARVGRYHPSRTIICAVEPGRTTLDAWATIVSATGDAPALTTSTSRSTWGRSTFRGSTRSWTRS